MHPLLLLSYDITCCCFTTTKVQIDIFWTATTFLGLFSSPLKICICINVNGQILYLPENFVYSISCRNRKDTSRTINEVKIICSGFVCFALAKMV